MIVVDTTVWVDYFNGQSNPLTDLLDELLHRQPLLMGDLILDEILQGFRSDADFDAALQALGKLEQAQMLNTELAIQSAKNFRALRKKGISIRKIIDSFIATFCIENGYKLLHNDRDFDPFEEYLGLKVVHPLTSEQ